MYNPDTNNLLTGISIHSNNFIINLFSLILVSNQRQLLNEMKSADTAVEIEHI